MSEQTPLLPPFSPVHANNGGQSNRFGKEVELDKPDESIKPSISPIEDAMPQLPSLPLTPLPKKGQGRRKKNPLTPKQRTSAECRLKIISDNFCPVPFSPAKTLDFSAHENLFRALGLWGFVHLQLDREVRSELLVSLIAYYDQSHRRSFVQDFRISVTRCDLARALNLPIKKEKVNDFECTDEAVSVLLEFISNYMPYGEDMCILPPEIMQATQYVKEKTPHKVDWAGLMWVLVEKELSEAPKSGVCHCASHLQCLIKHQHPNLFQMKEEPVLEPIVEAQEENASVVEAVLSLTNDKAIVLENEPAMAEEEDDYDEINAKKVRRLEDLGNVVSEKDNGELGLTLGEEEKVADGFEADKVGEDDQWPEGENEGFENCFRSCDFKSAVDIDFQKLTNNVHEQENQGMGHENDLPAKFSNMGRVSSSDFLQAMPNTNNTNAPYDQQLNSFNAASGDFLTMGAGSHKDVLSHAPNGLLYSGNTGKRQARAMDVEEEDHFEHNQQKRMRSAEPWSNTTLSFDECMDCMQTGVERVKLLFAEKDQTTVNMQMQMQYLNHMLQEKEQTIRSLRVVLEEQQQWRTVVRHYEHELNLMTQMLLGYKKALKDTRSSFAEYRKKCPQEEEALYKDVPGTGGLFLSLKEFEKHQLEKKEVERQELLGMFANLEKFLTKFSECEERIIMHNRKLVDLAGEVKQLKKWFVNSSSSSI